MNSLIASMEAQQNIVKTENGAKTYASTMDELYDFYALGGALRSRSEKDIISLFSKAFANSPIYAMKCLFYFRDIRGGQGERNLFRVIMKYLASSQIEIVKAVFDHIPEYGRWDDYYCFVGTPLEKEAFAIMKKQFFQDIKNSQ